MAAKHKAATEVTVAPTEERTPFQEFVHTQWPKAAAVAVVISGAILFIQHRTKQAEEARKSSWAEVSEEVDLATLGSPFGTQLPDADALRSLAEEHSDEITGPWVRVLEATKRIDERDYPGAKAALDRLAADFPGHPIVRQEFDFGEAGVSTLTDFVGNRIAALEAWERNRDGLFSNPPLPEGSPRVRIETSAGPIVVGLYAERAPKHVENFLKLVDEGFYAGTRFHRVIRGFMIQGGDPNSRDLESPGEWGQGGPGYKIEPETDNGLFHFEGYLAAAKKGGETESSGSQFYITTGSPHHLDGQHTVFGKVVEGADVVDTIENGEIAEGDRPADPVEVLSTEAL